MIMEKENVKPHPITCSQINQNPSTSEIRFEIRAPDIVEQLRKENTTLRQRVQELERYARHYDDCNIVDSHITLNIPNTVSYKEYEKIKNTCTCGLNDLLTPKN